MFQIEDDLTIHITRGDMAAFTVTAEEDGTAYMFQPGDVVRMKVTEKKDSAKVVFQKVFGVTEECEMVNILLEKEETKIGDVISKPVDYWYEIELNPYTNPQTIIGYDDDGAKILRLYPEAKDVTPDIEPEDVPVVDAELDLSSERPIQNQAVARAMLKVIDDVEKMVEDAQKTLEELKEFSNHLVNNANPHLVTARQAGAISEDDAFAKAGTTTFNEDGSITTAYNDGTSECTVFNEDGSITATRYVNGVVVETATTTFKGDNITCEVSGGTGE